ncbi:MAG: hypothetical protein ACEQSX_09190 [Baekduiaceae bacterium]
MGALPMMLADDEGAFLVTPDITLVLWAAFYVVSVVVIAVLLRREGWPLLVGLLLGFLLSPLASGALLLVVRLQGNRLH